MNKCLYCGKETKHPKYCNHSCAGHISGKVGGVACQKKFRMHKLGFYNSEVQQKNARKAAIANKKNRTGMNDVNVQKRCHETNKRNRTGFWSTDRKKSQETNKRNKTSIYNLATCRKGGYNAQKVLRQNKLGWYNLENQRKGGITATEILRKRSKYVWMSVNFLSKQEMECAKIILTKPIEGVNCHIKVGSKIIDFMPQKKDKMFQKEIVEYHPVLKFFHQNESLESYYISRRKVLDENGYKDVRLVVIQNLKELI